MKFRILLSKTNDLKFLSHLETVKLLERAFRRGNLPMIYSQGYNPHPNISSALPLSVGIESLYEVYEVDFEDFNFQEFIDNQQKYLPVGIHIFDIKISDDKDSLMSKVYYCTYRINFDNMKESKVKLLDFLSQNEFLIEKENKKGKINLVDIRSLVVDMRIEENYVVTTLMAGSKQNLNPTVLIESIFGKEFEEFDIIRLKILNEKLEDLY
jgi:radical SAM-linked protein